MKIIVATGLKAGMIALVILFNCLLIYLLLWDPYSLYFVRPEFSETDKSVLENYSTFCSLLNIAMLLGSGIWMLVLFRRRKKFLWLAPALSLATLLLYFKISSYYPDSYEEYTSGNRYRFRIEKWYLDGEYKYIRWKSADTLDVYDPFQKIVWVVDSSYEE